MPTPNEIDADFDALPGDVLAGDADFDALPGDAIDLNTGAVTPQGAAAPVNMSVGQPAKVEEPQSLIGKVAALPGKALTAAQQFSGGQLRGILGAPPEANVASVVGNYFTPSLAPLGPVPQLLAARAYQVNPLVGIGSGQGERAFATPEAEAVGKKAHEANVQAELLRQGPFGKKDVARAERAADVVDVATQGAANVLPQLIPGVGGVSFAAKIAPKITFLSPKLASFVVSAAEAGVMMPVYGVAGAEEGERAYTVKALLTNPDPVALAFMALAGAGGAVTRGRMDKAQAQARAQAAEQARLASQKPATQYKTADAYEKAIALANAREKLSTGDIQTALGLEYDDAARIMSRLEVDGVVGENTGNGVHRTLLETTDPKTPGLFGVNSRKSQVQVQADLPTTDVGFGGVGVSTGARHVVAIVSHDEMTKMADELEARVAAAEASGMRAADTALAGEDVEVARAVEAAMLGRRAASVIKDKAVGLGPVRPAEKPALALDAEAPTQRALYTHEVPQERTDAMQGRGPLSTKTKQAISGIRTQRTRTERGDYAPMLGPDEFTEVLPTPKEVPSQVAVVESPTAKYGVRAVIEWTPTKKGTFLTKTGREPVSAPLVPGQRRQVVEINSPEDAVAFRKALDKAGAMKPEVSFSAKALESMAQSHDPLLKDLLLYSAAELRAGKTSDGIVRNRNSGLVIMDEVPYLASFKDPALRARAARNLQVVAVNTKDGVRFGKLTISSGEYIVQPLDAKLDGLPTIKDGTSIPESMFGQYVKPMTEVQLEALFAQNKLPNMKGVESLGDFAAAPSSLTVQRRRAPTVETSLSGKTQPGRGQALPADVKEGVAATPFGAAYAFEAGGHQGPIAGAGGTKKASIFQKALPPGGEGGGGGGSGRPPGAPVSPEPLPPPDRPPRVNDVPEGVADRSMSMTKMYNPANANWLQRVHRLLVGEHHRAGIDLQQQMSVVLSLKNISRIEGTLLHALERTGKDALTGKDFQRELLQVFGGNRPASEVLARPELAPMRRVLEDAMSRRDFLHQELLKRGVINPRDEMFTEAAYNKYVARTTMAYILKPGEWLKIVERDKAVWSAAQKFLLKQNPDMGPGDVDALMRAMLNSGDAEKYLFSSPATSNAAAHTKARKLLPPELKALFGQDQAGAAYTIAHTLAAQERLYHTLLIMEEFARNPLYASRDLPVEHVGQGSLYEGWSKIEGTNAQFGALNNMYVHPMLKDLLVNLPNEHAWGTKNLFSGALQELSSWSKGNETALGGAMPWANNIIGGVQHMMMAGIAPWETVSLGRKMGFAAQGLMDYAANPYANTPYVEFIRDAIRVGADTPGFGSVETVGAARDELKAGFLKEIIGDKNLSPFDRMVTGLRHIKKARSHIGNAFDVPDRLWRLSTFAQLTDRELGRMGVTAERPPTPQQKEQALRIAARRVARAFPMPDRLGVLPDQARRYTGVLAPYLTYRTEVMRNYMMLPGTIAEDWQRMVPSLAAWGMVLYAGKKLYDYRDPMRAKLIEQEFASVPDNVAKHRPAMVATSYDGVDGRPVLMDLTPAFDVLRYMSGGSDSPYLNVGIGMLSSLSEGGGAEGKMRQLGGAAAPGFAKHERRRRAWETGWAATADMAWADWGMLPKAPIRVYDEWLSTQPQPALPMGGPIAQHPDVAAGRTFGLNLVRQPNPAAVGMDLIRAKNSLVSGLREVGSYPDDYPGRGLLQSFDKIEAAKDLEDNFSKKEKNK